MRGTVVDPNRRGLARARDADDAPTSARLAEGRAAPWIDGNTWTAAGRSARSGGGAAGGQRDEVGVRNRVFVFLAKEALQDEHIKGRRRGVRIFALKQTNGAGVLLTSENQLLLFFALRCLLPHRHRDGHHDGHDRHHHQQGHHRVAVFGLTA
jgi:hypothetical protein